ncbi:MAG: Plug domain-containing protein [Crocinitomicaceae bacterium]
MKNGLFLLFSFLAFVAQSQVCDLSGRCVDKRNKGIEGILIKSPQAKSVAYSDANGKFILAVTPGDSVVLFFNVSDSSGTKIEQHFFVGFGEKRKQIGNIVFNFQQENTVEFSQRKTNPFVLEPLKFKDIQNIPLGGVERFLTYTTAAVSNNELTSNYNVRGGNYDENLVYVNGFLIYRPFLTRSGQQEGMSFVNTALVDQISFSAGGFDARYGDKLSSVLDIEYRKPTTFQASAMASLLGVETHVEQALGPRFTYLIGARYRANGYLLNSLPAKGAYNPVFIDGQFVTNYALTEKLNWSILGHFSSNDYRFAPQSQKTDFGSYNEAYSLNIYFEGQEKTRFITAMGGTSLKWQPNKKTNLDLYATVFRSVEREYFDILGEYFLNQLETDPAKADYGDSIGSVGVGGFLNHARNKLNATIFNVYHNGSRNLKEGFKDDERLRFFSNQLNWGINLQHDQFHDVLSEWRLIDSSGYSIPQGLDNTVGLTETIKSKLELSTFRTTGFLQLNSLWSKNKQNYVTTTFSREKDSLSEKKTRHTFVDTLTESASRLALNSGVRVGYTSINQEFYVTPRVSLTYFPRVYMRSNGKLTRRDVRMRLASGLYYQPPFYREFRTFDGQLNTNVKSQKSFHIVAGTDVYVNLWGRPIPFKLGADIYYKYMWDVNPYEIDNVRTRYYANNDAVAYAYGLDFHMNGQFIKGIESYFKFGLLSTKENLVNDHYTDYFNSAGEKIYFGYTYNDSIVDSTVVNPGYIRRPTDQLFTFGALIQDQMPGYESFSVQMGLQFGTNLPYGPPDHNRYKDTLKLKSYFRVDIGFSYDFLYKKKMKISTRENFWTKNFDDAILSFEVFNLLGINNVLSKQWIQATDGGYYAIPNNLTQRRFNLKLILRL